MTPQGGEGDGRVGYGLGLLPFTTVFQHAKRTAQTRAWVAVPTGLAPATAALSTSYEIHCGRPRMADDALATHVGYQGSRVGHRDRRRHSGLSSLKT